MTAGSAVTLQNTHPFATCPQAPHILIPQEASIIS